MSFNQLLSIWMGRWRLVACCAVISAVVAFAVSTSLTKKYTATAAVLIDMRSTDALGSTSDRAQASTSSMMATQVDLITSERVARKVVSALRLDERPEYSDLWLKHASGAGDKRNFVALQLQLDLSVRFNRESNVINISFTHANPQLAAAVANAFAESAVETNLELRVEPAKQFSAWYDSRLAQLRESLEKAQTRYNEYQRSKGLIATTGIGQVDIETTKLTQLTEQLLSLRATRAETNSRQAQARSSASTSPDVLGSPVIAALRANVLRSESNLRQLQLQLGNQHPQVIAASEEAVLIKNQLDREMENTVRALGANNNISERRENDLLAQVEAQRNRLIALGRGTSELTVLQRDVENAQRALDTAAGRQSQSALESQLLQGNVYLLTPAAEPGDPSAPKRRLNTLTAAACGLLVGLGMALWRESRQPIVRTASDLLIVLDLPVMGNVPLHKARHFSLLSRQRVSLAGAGR